MMPSSVRFGVRPRIAIARSNSSALSPCSAASSGVILLRGSSVIAEQERRRPAGNAGQRPAVRVYASLQRADKAGKEGLPVSAAEKRVGRVLGVRHQAQHRARLVEDTGDRSSRAVEIVGIAKLSRGAAITERDEAALLEPIERVGIGGIAAIVMRDGPADRLTRRVAAGEDRLVVLDAQIDVLAGEGVGQVR